LPPVVFMTAFERHLSRLRRDFRIEVDRRKAGDAYRLGEFRASSAKMSTSVMRPFPTNQDQLTTASRRVTSR
jgi:hypothetical protein